MALRRPDYIFFPHRDSFIDAQHQPKNRVVKASMLDFLWSYEDENSQVDKVKSFCCASVSFMVPFWM